MATITEQVREIISMTVTEGSVSRYAIAKKVGISETHLNRFLTGERGLSLTKLDELGEMFGMKISVTVQQLPRPTKRGKRPSKKRTPMSTATITPTFQQIANGAAEDAFVNNFSSHRGMYLVTEAPTKSGEAVCVYNSHPYHDKALRPKEEQMFRESMAAAGIAVLGYGIYPRVGEEKGYTYAMILDATEDQKSLIRDRMADAVAAISELIRKSK